MTHNITCIECPMGCAVEVETENGAVVKVSGNGCPRGKAYAENEVTCPKRVVTSSVRAENGEMIPVKTDRPIRKSEIFAVMSKINGLHPKLPIAIGDVILRGICDDADLVATGKSR